MWTRRSHMIAALTGLVGELGETKFTCSTVTKKKWYWNQVHQEVFDQVKQRPDEEVILIYPTYRELFEIYTDASTRQLVAVSNYAEWKTLSFLFV